MVNVCASKKYKSPDSVAISRYEMPQLVEVDLRNVVMVLIVDIRLSGAFACALMKPLNKTMYFKLRILLC